MRSIKVTVLLVVALAIAATAAVTPSSTYMMAGYPSW